jgi:molecular chaperone DnaK
MAKDNRSLGRFHLDGLPPAQRGVPQIEVTFDIDANGILHVSAKDKGTGKEQKIRIEASSGLTDAEIEKMRNEAKANEANDKIEKERVEKINQADALIFQSEKQLKEYGEKLSEGNKSAIEGALAELKTAHASQDVAAIDAGLEKLNTAWTAASQEMYAAGETAGATENTADASANGASEAEDVAFEEVK